LWGPYFNVAPTQDGPVVVAIDGARELRFMRWGLIPSWASDPAIGNGGLGEVRRVGRVPARVANRSLRGLRINRMVSSIGMMASG
jgi:putative SOS response-associated peptidase YedK